MSEKLRETAQAVIDKAYSLESDSDVENLADELTALETAISAQEAPASQPEQMTALEQACIDVAHVYSFVNSNDLPIALERFREVARAALKAAQSAPPAAPPRWIPMSEREPEHSGEYLCVSNLGFGVHRFAAGMGVWSEHHGEAITHWMPLPKSPETQVPPTQAEPNSLDQRAMPLEPVAPVNWVRDGIADFIADYWPHNEYWPPTIAERIREIEIRPPISAQPPSADAVLPEAPT